MERSGMRLLGLLPILPLVLVGPACGEQASPGGAPGTAIHDSAGIRIVENAAPDRPAGLRPEEIAGLVPPDSALTAVPWGVAADPETGRIYVADRTAPRVVVFDRTGAYVETLGRGGEGPGEFRDPTALSVGASGVLTVWDTGRGILSRWSSDGELLDERRAPISYWGPGLHDGADALVTVTSKESGREMEQSLVAVADSDTTVLRSLPHQRTMVELPCMSGPMPRLFSPMVVWSARGDSVYVVKGPEYRIDAYAGGSLLSSIRRPVDALRVTAERAATRARARFRGFLRRCGITPEALVDAVGFVERISPIQWIVLDPAGRLWVTRSPGDMAAEHVDVLDAAGRYRGTVETSVMPLAFVSESRFVGLTLQQETGRTSLSLYELRESADSATASADRERPAWAPPVRSDLPEFRDCPACPVMVVLPRGRYTMGAPKGEWPAAEHPNRPAWTEEAEKPQVNVTIGYRLAIGKYEVTFEQWDACVEAGGCDHRPDDEGWGRGDRPVIHVSRSDARQYARWLSRRTGRDYRLPSEAEWEYAARAGTQTAFWWGDELGDGRIPCDGCGTEWDERSTAPVGSFPANPWGLHDMLSNVQEWVADCWHETHAGNPGDGSARTTSSPWWKESGWEDRRGRPCQRPAERGGAFGFYPWAIRVAARGYWWPNPNWHERKSATQGFRVALTVESGARPAPPDRRAESSPRRSPWLRPPGAARWDSDSGR